MSNSVVIDIMRRGWRNVREAGPRRLVLTGMLVLLALFVSRYGWGMSAGSELPVVSPAADLAIGLVTDELIALMAQTD